MKIKTIFKIRPCKTWKGEVNFFNENSKLLFYSNKHQVFVSSKYGKFNQYRMIRYGEVE